MSQGRRRMHLAGFLIAGPVAHSHALWRNPAHPVPFLSTEYYVEIARILERGRFDLIFFADRLAIADRYGGRQDHRNSPWRSGFDPHGPDANSRGTCGNH